MLLYVIRHGDPIYETDTLTPKGELQAQALAKRLAVNGLDRIYSSPLGRAKLTAQPTCDLLNLDYEIEEWTSESLAWKKFSTKLDDGRNTWVFFMQNTRLRNDETINLSNNWHTASVFSDRDYKKGYDELIESSDDFLARQGYVREGSVYRIERPNDDKVAVFCHHGFGVSWLSHLMGIPPHLFWVGFDMTHTGVTILDFVNNKDGYTVPKCLVYSDISHLYKEGLPLQYNNYLDI